jgi:hypothetical protein
MKIYNLTIGINEEMDEVEFIQEEQYTVSPADENTDPIVSEIEEPEAEEDDFHSWIRKIMHTNFNIIGHA